MSQTILLIMPPFWDPICPPQGIVCLRAYLQEHGYQVHQSDFNTDFELFDLQRQYFEYAKEIFPHWRYYNIFRNGPAYFSRHQLAWLLGHQQPKRYAALSRLILNIDGQSVCTTSQLRTFDAIIESAIRRVQARTEKLVKDIEPDIVGCTMLESTFACGLAALETTKAVRPACKTLMGGPGPVFGDTMKSGNFQRIVSACPWVDAIISGEGEPLFLKFLKGEFDGRAVITNYDLESPPEQHLVGSSPGLPILQPATPHNVRGGIRSKLLDVNKLPLGTFEGLDIDQYPLLSLYTTRGCSYSCTFCHEVLYWPGYRKKTVERVVEELRKLAALYGKHEFYICDSLVNHVATDLSNLLCDSGETYLWDCYLRVTEECLSRDRVQLWARGGMIRARIGVESVSEEILVRMNKKRALGLLEDSLKNLADAGICTTTLWIAGFPGETESDFEESLNFLRQNHRNIFEADVAQFCFASDGLVGSKKMGKEFDVAPIYPEEFDDLLLFTHCELKRGVPMEERLRRIHDFERLRMQLGIPNPYSMKEQAMALERWTHLGHVRHGSGKYCPAGMSQQL